MERTRGGTPAPLNRETDGFVPSALRVARWVEAYRKRLPDLPVLSPVRPGEVRAALPETPPETPEGYDAILADLDRVIVPGLTHWNHPGFMAYFCSSSADPGLLAEFVTAAFNVNAMLWRTSPAATELEERMVEWTRRFVGLPDAFDGVIQDTASTSTFVALLAARHRAFPNAREDGLAGGSAGAGGGPGRVYGSELAHSSLDKAVIAAGLGGRNLVRLEVDGTYALRPEALDRALRDDRAAGRVPVMVCATIGTTSCASVDPVEAIAGVCAEHDVWLHVDAAYAGPAASLPEQRPRFAGWEHADSIVLNPHKWMAVPLDCSLLLGRRLDQFRASLALTPEYLSSDAAATNLMDVGLALGRRFRALKLWFVFRREGADGIRAMIRRHVELADRFAGRVEAEPRLELAAPPSFGTVCFRVRADDGNGATTGVGETAAASRRLLDRVNRDGRIFVSHTELDGRYTIRLVVGSIHTGPAQLETAWHAITTALEDGL
ncbi:MAG: pyridoxal phosphate-dependent decarboxylase family protein [Gemmatimonadota bacterium]